MEKVAIVAEEIVRKEFDTRRFHWFKDKIIKKSEVYRSTKTTVEDYRLKLTEEKKNCKK